MKQFSILRYLKQFRLLIFFVSIIGALLVVFYGKSRQHYVASTVIQYTNSEAKQGYTPDGSPLNVEEIYSSTVIDAALTDLGYQANIDSIRSNCYVEEVILETQQKMSEALLEKGEGPSYIADTYRVYYIGDSDTGEDYARNMLDAVSPPVSLLYSTLFRNVFQVVFHGLVFVLDDYDIVLCKWCVLPIVERVKSRKLAPVIKRHLNLAIRLQYDL